MARGIVGRIMAKPSLVAEINQFNIRQVVGALGGTKQAAQALGVSQRSVQRYLTEGKQRQRPSQAVREALANAPKRAAPEGVGITFSGTFKIRGSDEQQREREINDVYDADTWNELSERAEMGDEAGAWQIVADSYLHGGTMSMLDGDILIGEE